MSTLKLQIKQTSMQKVKYSLPP